MINCKKAISMLFLAFTVGTAIAQNNTNSPYTMNGYGRLSDHVNIAGKSMGGVAYGMRSSDYTNFANPASYTAMDSLTFIFEGGVSLQNVNFQSQGTKLNAHNSSLDYLVMHFRAKPWMAFSMGLLPYSNVGYSFGQINRSESHIENSSMVNYSGNGGVHQAYLGAGFDLMKGLSVGVNLSYLWGDVTRTMVESFPNNASAFAYTEASNLSVNNFNVELGVQYAHRFGKKHLATVGAVFSPGHTIANKFHRETSTAAGTGVAGQVSVNDLKLKSGLPTTFGLGVSYVYDSRWTVGADYLFENWSKVKYAGQEGLMLNRHKLSVGAEWHPNVLGRSYFSHIRYRLGAYCSKPYYKFGGERMVNEYGVTAGFGLPVPRTRSIITIAGEYGRYERTNVRFINENIFRLSVGITFNQNWFVKNRVE